MEQQIQEILSRYRDDDIEVVQLIEALQAEIDDLKRKLIQNGSHANGSNQPRPTVDVNLNGIQLDLF
ncbi:MAG: hypothetical protein AAF633_16855 [Chloroflexota bacterium]